MAIVNPNLYPNIEFNSDNSYASTTTDQIRYYQDRLLKQATGMQNQDLYQTYNRPWIDLRNPQDLTLTGAPTPAELNKYPALASAWDEYLTIRKLTLGK